MVKRMMYIVILGVLLAGPLLIEVNRPVPYYLIVLAVFLYLFRDIQDPDRSRNRFLYKCYQQRRRSYHVNAFREGAVFLLQVSFILAVSLSGGIEPFTVYIRELWGLWIVVLVIALPLGYIRVEMNETLYEEAVQKMVENGETLRFLEEDPIERERILKNQTGDDRQPLL
ncbi:hypothetical protein [Salisediminibacterium selenitireducens]|nr:hypothetical protein [Salisediminibacterium selenitireducens]